MNDRTTETQKRTRAGPAPRHAGGGPPGPRAGAAGGGACAAATSAGPSCRPERRAGPRLRGHAPARGAQRRHLAAEPGSVYPTLQMLEDEGLVRSRHAGRHPGLRADRRRPAEAEVAAAEPGVPRGSAATSDERRRSATRGDVPGPWRPPGRCPHRQPEQIDRAHRDRPTGAAGAIPAARRGLTPGNLRTVPVMTPGAMTHSPTPRPPNRARPAAGGEPVIGPSTSPRSTPAPTSGRWTSST